MKFSEQWLREWIDLPLNSEALCEHLTMLGLEVDSVAPAAPALPDTVVAGRIATCAAHPQADALSVCTVDVGQSGALTIVCGAPNVRSGLTVPVALVGTRLPGGLVIEASDLRGVTSQGMLCASAELGLDDDDAGLLELDEDVTPGTPVAGHLRLDDQIIEIDLTPNRGDCLSILGVARDASAGRGYSLKSAAANPVPASSQAVWPVSIENPDACPRYCGRLIEGVAAGARTPDWMRERLRRAGLRSLGILVDVTNCVMLELGQPMHAFDADCLSQGIVVRDARAGERVLLLDGTEVELNAGTLVIADHDGPVALAGVMGGETSAVSQATERVFLESAHFSPSAMAGIGREYKRHSDALHRFERGVDPAMAEQAIERATALIVDIAGGQPGPVVVETGRETGDRESIDLRHARLVQLLGSDIPRDSVPGILRGLGMEVSEAAGDGSWRVRPPSWRFDVEQEADLIEEVARVHGYDRLPSAARRVPVELAGLDESRVPAYRIQETMLQRGYSQAVTYGFVDPQLQSRLAPGEAPIDLDNPISAQLAQMRTTLWSSLLPAWQHNLRRREPRIRLFETGQVFSREQAAPMGIRQVKQMAGIASGTVMPEAWDNDARKVDFYDVKADVEALFNLQGLAPRERLAFVADTHPALHPGRSARIRYDGQHAGWLGEIHPELKKILNIKEIPYLFELKTEIIVGGSLPRYRVDSPYPAVRRDLALLVPDDLPVAGLMESAWAAEQTDLRDVVVFDVYQGDDMENGFKSVALGLIFQADSSTLTDGVVDDSVAAITDRLSRDHGARIRGQ